VAELGDQMNDAKAKSVAATTDRETVEARLKTLTEESGRRDRLRQRRADLERSLTAHGGTTDPAAVRCEITRLADRLTDVQARHAAARERQQTAG
jgi:hypothetical protein